MERLHQRLEFDYNGKRFIIRLFLGTVPPNPRNWATNNGCVGSFAVLPPMDIAASPRANWPNVTAHNKIPLMQGLTEKGYDGQYVTATVEYLKDNLQWRVQTVSFLDLSLSKPWVDFGISFVQNILGLSDIALCVWRLMRNSSTAK
jgi:hypothetical protein